MRVTKSPSTTDEVARYDDKRTRYSCSLCAMSSDVGMLANLNVR